MKLSISYNIISKYRTELMGVAMINVLTLHILSWTQFSNPHWLSLLLSASGGLVFTEGFLFLSGYGLVYSIKNNSNIKQFYCRRLQRLYLPYFLISFPFFLSEFVEGRFGLGCLLLKLSTLYYWFYGNDGMWYISLSVVLYALFPYLFKKISHRESLFIMMIYIILIIVVLFASEDYFNMILLSIKNTPFFIFGIFFGVQSVKERKLSLFWILCIPLLLLISYCVNFEGVGLIRELVKRVFGISFFCLLFLWIEDRAGILMELLRFFGSFSLEIYIIHLLSWDIFSQMISDNNISAFVSVLFAVLICKPVHILCNKVVSLMYTKDLL